MPPPRDRGDDVTAARVAPTGQPGLHGRVSRVVVLGAGLAGFSVVAVLLARRTDRRSASSPAAFVSHGETSSPEEIDAFWTDERLDSAVAEEMPTVDPAYMARLTALVRLLWWLPARQRERVSYSLLGYVHRLRRLLTMAE